MRASVQDGPLAVQTVVISVARCATWVGWPRWRVSGGVAHAPSLDDWVGPISGGLPGGMRGVRALLAMLFSIA